MQRAVVDRAVKEGGGLMILGIHLCGLLALRAVELCNNNQPYVKLFALKPCCLPGLQHVKEADVFKLGRHEFATESVCAAGKYEAQSKTNVGNI